jgi:hypothetical protein
VVGRNERNNQLEFVPFLLQIIPVVNSGNDEVLFDVLPATLHVTIARYGSFGRPGTGGCVFGQERVVGFTY